MHIISFKFHQTNYLFQRSQQIKSEIHTSWNIKRNVHGTCKILTLVFNRTMTKIVLSIRSFTTRCAEDHETIYETAVTPGVNRLHLCSLAIICHL